MKHSVPHDLSPDLAKQAARSALDSYAKRFAEYSPKVNWTQENRADIAFSVKGVNLSGFLEVGDKAIDMDLDVPFLLRPFKSKAMGVIEGEIKEWIGKAKNGAL